MNWVSRFDYPRLKSYRPDTFFNTISKPGDSDPFLIRDTHLPQYLKILDVKIKKLQARHEQDYGWMDGRADNAIP